MRAVSTMVAFLFVVFSLVAWTVSSAIHSTAPANPLPYKSIQPDGSTTPPLQFWGDGIDNYISDEMGYLVIEDEGWLVYAQEPNDEPSTTDKKLRGRRLGSGEEKTSTSTQLKAGQHAVGSIDPSKVPGLTTISERKRHMRQHRSLYQGDIQTARTRIRYSETTFQSLVLLLRFADHTDRDLPTSSQINKFFNKKDISETENKIAPTGSIHELFWQNSYGSLDARAKVIDWITLSETEEYYANGEYGFQKLAEGIHEALHQVFEGDQLSSLGRIDGLGLLHSGYGAEYGGDDCFGQTNVNRIWSHQAGSLGFVNPYSNFVTGGNETEGIPMLVVPDQYYVASALRNKCGSDITRVGIVAHEIGHQLGLPDLYDKTFEGNGAGYYDPMSKSWGWDGTGLYPPIFSAWSKMTLGWVSPLEITTNGYFFIGSSANVPQVYIIRQGFADGEYLLIENRQPEGFDSQLEGGGIAVWHIDELANDERGYLGQENYPWNGNHYKVRLLQADGNQDLERGINNGDASDLWHKDGEFTVLGPSSSSNDIVSGSADAYIVPNTDSNRHGNITISGVWIHNFTSSGEYMGFTVHGLDLNVNASTGYPHPDGVFTDLEVNATSSPTSSPVLSKKTSSPTLSPITPAPTTASPTVSQLPSIDPWTIIYYYPDWLELGCRRKSLAEFSSWEKNRYENVGECCNLSMGWSYSRCVQSSMRLMGYDLTDSVVGAAPIQMAMGNGDHFAAP